MRRQANRWKGVEGQPVEVKYSTHPVRATEAKINY